MNRKQFSKHLGKCITYLAKTRAPSFTIYGTINGKEAIVRIEFLKLGEWESENYKQEEKE